MFAFSHKIFELLDNELEHEKKLNATDDVIFYFFSSNQMRLEWIFTYRAASENFNGMN